MLRSLSRHSALAVGCLLSAACQSTACKNSEHQNTVRQNAMPSAATTAPAEPSQRLERKVAGMGTEIHFIAYGSAEQGERGFALALSEMERLERLLSSWLTDSDVARLNQNAGHWVNVSAETAHLVERGLWIGKLSDGAFDISFQVLGPLWRFGTGQTFSVPSAQDVASARQHIDFRRIAIDEPAQKVKLGAGQQIALEGLAKGFIVDRMAQQLRDAGLTRFLIQAGGDLYAEGSKPDGSAWQSGIKDPRGADSFATLPLKDCAFSTAGDYARTALVNGKRYHHIIDPKTGYPAAASRSVTVWAKSALLADMLDDAVFILGAQRGLKLVDSIEQAGAVIVDADNKLWISDSLRTQVHVLHDPTDAP